MTLPVGTTTVSPRGSFHGPASQVAHQFTTGVRVISRTREPSEATRPTTIRRTRLNGCLPPAREADSSTFPDAADPILLTEFGNGLYGRELIQQTLPAAGEEHVRPHLQVQ